MKETGPRFEEPWPDDETQLVMDAVRSAVRGTGAASGTSGAMANPLAEAGRRWARAHQSASLMRARLSALEASMDAELGTASEADRIASYRAWRTVSDAATWTSLTQLEAAALVDPLTGVGNRRALDLMLTRAMSVARRAGSELVVAAVDLDGLKRINDSQGHAEGDRTLTSLVNAFGEGLRASDTVFRTGGDEFAVVLPGMGLGDVDPLMHRISAGGTPGFTWGAAALTAEHQHPAELLDAADVDLYRRRGVERDEVRGGVVGGAGAGAAGGVGGAAPVVGRRHPDRSIKPWASRRANVAVAAVLVAIAGTVGAVTPLSPANHAALSLKHPGRPSGSSGVPAVTPPTTTPPAPTQSPATSTTPVGPTATPVTRGAGSTGIQLAAVTTPSPGSSGVGATTPNPAASTPPIAPPPTAAPPPTVPPTTVPASTPPSNRRPTDTLPPQAAAAQAAHDPDAHVVNEAATDQGTPEAPAQFRPSTDQNRGGEVGCVRRDH